MEIINDYELIPTIDAVVDELAEIYALPAYHIEHLLQQQYKWNTDRLSDGEHSLECTSPTAPLTAHNISHCPICLESDNVQGYTLQCTHAFCTDCLTGQIKAAVDNGPACISISCLAHKCKTTLPRPIIESVLKTDTADADTLRKYHSHVIRDFITNYGRKGLANQRLIFCVNPECNKVAVIPYGCSDDIAHCPCGTDTCVQCGTEAHSPCTCTNIKNWTLKSSDEGETIKWLAVNTKACPKCNVNIEKNQGCNHMTCKKCRHEFCWICFADWRNHTYNCAAAPTLHTDTSATRNELAHYAKYYTAYQAHTISLKFAMGLPAFDKPDELYLRAAKAAIIRARNTCKYSYVVMYYLSALTPLFEDYFKRFEGSTDALHELIEHKSSMLDEHFTLERFTKYQTDIITRTGELLRDLDIFITMIASIVDDNTITSRGNIVATVSASSIETNEPHILNDPGAYMYDSET